MTLLKREKAAWFPTAELREDNKVEVHAVTGLERAVLGWREAGQQGGSEGVCWATPTYTDQQEAEGV